MLLTLLAAIALPSQAEEPVFAPGPYFSEALPHGQWSIEERLSRRGPWNAGDGVRLANGGHVLQGRLVDSGGEPLAGVFVGVEAVPEAAAHIGVSSPRLRSWVDDPPGSLDLLMNRDLAFTDERGLFRVDGLAPGPHRATAVATDSIWCNALPALADGGMASSWPREAAGDPADVPTFIVTDPDPRSHPAHGRPDLDQGKGLARVELRGPHGDLCLSTSAIQVFRQLPGGRERWVASGGPRDIRYSLDPFVQLQLLPGTYRLSARQAQLPGQCGVGLRPHFPWRLPAECLFEVKAGKVTTARATFQPGGRLRILLRDPHETNPPTTPPLTEWADFTEDCYRWVRAMGRTTASHHFNVTVEPEDGGAARHLQFLVPACAYESRKHSLPGGPFVALDLLPPGRYRLRFACETAAVEPCVVVVGESRVTDVELEIVPR